MTCFLDELGQRLINSRADPDLEFEGLLKRQHTRVKYFQGSLMNAMDLERAKVTENRGVVRFSCSPVHLTANNHS